MRWSETNRDQDRNELMCVASRFRVGGGVVSLTGVSPCIVALRRSPRCSPVTRQWLRVVVTVRWALFGKALADSRGFSISEETLRTFPRRATWRTRAWITTAAFLSVTYARRERVRRQAAWILDATKSRNDVVGTMRGVMSPSVSSTHNFHDFCFFLLILKPNFIGPSDEP